MRDVVFSRLVVSYMYDERDVMSVFYMYVWMDGLYDSK